MSEEDRLEQEALNKYLNMIANDYSGELAKRIIKHFRMEKIKRRNFKGKAYYKYTEIYD